MIINFLKDNYKNCIKFTLTVLASRNDLMLLNSIFNTDTNIYLRLK